MSEFSRLMQEAAEEEARRTGGRVEVIEAMSLNDALKQLNERRGRKPPGKPPTETVEGSKEPECNCGPCRRERRLTEAVGTGVLWPNGEPPTGFAVRDLSDMAVGESGGKIDPKRYSELKERLKTWKAGTGPGTPFKVQEGAPASLDLLDIQAVANFMMACEHVIVGGAKRRTPEENAEMIEVLTKFERRFVIPCVDAMQDDRSDVMALLQMLGL